MFKTYYPYFWAISSSNSNQLKKFEFLQLKYSLSRISSSDYRKCGLGTIRMLAEDLHNPGEENTHKKPQNP